jgi:glycine dehydrogenase subunit 1
LAVQCHSKSEYLKSRLEFAEVINQAPTFNEFAIRLHCDAQKVVERMAERGYLAGLPLAALGAGEPNDLLIAVTEKRSRQEMDAFADVLKETACN